MRLTRTQLLAAAGGLLAIVLAIVAPGPARAQLGAAAATIRDADPRWLALAALGFVLAFICMVGAWVTALAAAGARICPRQTAARLGIGCLVNTFTPARLGDAVKVALCSQALDTPGAIWRTGGVYAALGAARCLALAALVFVGAAAGVLPWWPLLALVGVALVLAAAGRLSGRLAHRRPAQFFAGLGALERSPRRIAAVLGWTFGMAGFRLGATAAVAASLGLPHAFLAALLILPVLDVAAAFPLTPGAIGIGSGAVAVALASRGIGIADALATGIGLQALESLVSLAAGSAGVLYLAQGRPGYRQRIVRVAAFGASAALALVVGALMLKLDLS